MNREDIIRMAREAGAAAGSPAPGAPEIIFTQCLDVERFAALVAAAEREACAKFLDDAADTAKRADPQGFVWQTVSECAAAIRARGQA